jgi:hypothetical protein
MAARVAPEQWGRARTPIVRLVELSPLPWILEPEWFSPLLCAVWRLSARLAVVMGELVDVDGACVRSDNRLEESPGA